MKASWNWLSEWVDLSGLEPREVADRMTMAGLEVEGVETLGGELDGIVVGRIVHREQHPDADKLSVCRVDVGGDEELEIVCGAPNARDGLVAPVATIGSRLPDGTKIKKGKLRGVVSHGMLCSARELALSESHEGLMELAVDAAPGTPIADALGLRDVVIEFSITPNRSDAFSMRGLAREIAALYGRELLKPMTRADVQDDPTLKVGDVASVQIEDAEGCARYAGAVVVDVAVGPSPEWMVRRLAAIGQRPVNNLVDVTNYVLFEYGQPLHAFDLDRLEGARVIARRARAGETIESIDHVERALEPHDLVIADGRRPVAIAGVMGGVDSEIDDTTTRVLIECAHFAPSTVRRTARRLGMHSESSHRFERGVDWYGTPAALERAIELLVATQEHLGTTCRVAAGRIDEVAREITPAHIPFDLDMPGRILGVDVSHDEVIERLVSLGAAVVDGSDGTEVIVPTFRPDLERPIDLVEEIGRLRGYDDLPSALPPGTPGAPLVRRTDAPVEQGVQPVQSQDDLDAIERVRDACVDAGLFEAINWSMVDPGRLARFAPDVTPTRLRNPLGEETSAMRTTLLPSLLTNVAYNLARGADRVALFETGHVFPPDSIEVEPMAVAAVLAGRADQGWMAGDRTFDGHDAAGLVDALGAATGRALVIAAHDAPPVYAHPGATGQIVLGDRIVGWVGMIHPDVLDAWEIEVPVAAFEIDLSAVLAVTRAEPRHAPIPKTPASTRDLALVVATDVPWRRIRGTADGFHHKYLESVELFDVYQGEHMAEGQRSLAMRVTWRSAKGSLTDEQVERAHSAFVEHMTSSLGASVRA